MSNISDHYGSEGLTARILAALGADGRDTSGVDVDMLAGLDEFHLGGRVMTERIIAGLAGAEPDYALDVGCGIGGPARTLARRLGCNVTGVDLTPEFVTTASELTALVGLEESASFKVGSAADLDVDDASVDVVTLLHVGMNIADKDAMAAEFARVLRPGGTLAVYDIMRVGPGSVDFPVPWSSVPETSFVETVDRYVEVLRAAGFDVQQPENQTELVLQGLEAAADKPPSPVNLGVVMGPEFSSMFSNLLTAMRASTLAPTLIFATNQSV